MMERRRSKRKTVNIDAEINLDNERYTGTIENISENGINIETSSEGLLSTSTRFSPGTEFGVEFQIPPGETIKLHCKVMWSFKDAPLGLNRKIGAEIIFPPPAFMDFYKESQ